MASKKVNFLITAKDNASKTFRTVKNSLKAIHNVAKPAIAGIKTFAKVTGLATGALVLMGRQSFLFMDTLDKVSRKVGVSTEFLQKLRFAGQQTGVDVRKLDMGLQRFARRVDEARNGMGEAKGALTELGIQFNKTDGTAKTTEEIFMDVARSMSNIDEGGKVLRLGFKLFDSEGVALVTTMKELNEQFGIFEDLGLGIPQEAIDKSVTFRDNLNETRNLINQITNLTFAGLADELDAIATVIKEKLLTIVKDAGGADNLADALGNQLKAIVLVIVKGLEDFLNLMRTLINSFATALQNLSDKFNLGLDVFGQGDQRQQLAEYKRNLEGLIEMRNRLVGGATFGKGSEMPIFSDANDKELARINEEIVTTEANIKALLLTMGDSKLIKDAFSFAGLVEDIFFPKETTETKKPEEKKPAETFFSLEEFTGGLASLQTEIMTTEKMLSEGLVDTIKGVNDAFVDFFLGTSDGFIKLRDDIKRNFVDFMVREFITSGLINFLIDIFGEDTFMTRAVSQTFGFGPKTRATGGPLMAGQTALVGEKGPEIITASQDMMVKPTNQVGSFATGGANVTFNINAMDTQGFDQLLTQRKNQIIAMVNQGLNQRGGSLI